MSLRLATGQAAFAGDHSLPGLLHVVLRRSPSPHAHVASVATAAARRQPGVAAVLTCDDAPALLPRVVRFVGDRLAIVAAEDAETARRGAELLEFELQERPAVLEADGADESAVVARVSVSQGELERALAGADRVVGGEWRLPFVPAVPLEPPTALTWLDEDQRLVVRTSAESPFRLRGELAERLSVPAARLRVVRPSAAAGGAGRYGLVVEDACAAVTLLTGRPARLSLTGSEALAVSPGRPAQLVRLRLALKRGELAALEAQLVIDVGAGHERASDLLRSALRHALGLYRVPHLRLSAVAVRTNRPPASGARGADDGLAFVLESAIDEAAVELGADPGALRRAHLLRPGDGERPLAELGERPGRYDAREAAELLQRLERVAPPAVPGPRDEDGGGTPSYARGIAVARVAHLQTAPAGAATVRLLEDGSFALTAGPNSLRHQDEPLYTRAAAAVLGVPARRIVCAAADTDTAPYLEGGDAPSGSALGRAVEQAAARMKDEIRQVGARLLAVPADTVDVQDGRVTGPEGRSASFAEIGAAALRQGAPLSASAATAADAAPQSLAAAAADVVFDDETGGVQVLGLHAVVTGGPFAEPQHAAAQVEGALASAVEHVLAAGIGAASPERAWPRSLALCTALDVPPLSVSFAGGADPLSRFDADLHAQAAGRAAQAAIANAVARASALRVRSLPLHPARLLAALGGKAAT